MRHCDVARSGEIFSSVLIVDDHPLYSDALASALHVVFPGTAVDKAGSLGQAMAMLDDGADPELVIFDLKLPDVCGISGFLKLRARIPHIPILVISSLTARTLVETLMQEGAAGFLTKDTTSDVLKPVLEEIAAGRKYVPMAYRKVAESARAPADDPARAVHPKLAALTPQQQKVMRLICQGKPNKQIAYELSLAEATVKAHITALLRRLGACNRTQAALMVEGAMADAMEETDEPEALSFLSR